MATRRKSAASAGPSASASESELLAIYEDMVRQRRLEEALARAYGLGKIYGFCHLYIGQEAISAGTTAALQPDDIVVGAYRIHGQALSKGISAQEIVDELFGKATGCTGGVGGSMHLFDVDKGFWGGWGLVGQQVPMACGVAFAQRAQKTGKVVVTFMGDGAVQQGAIHESLNMAAIWNLPIVMVVENNHYGMGTAVDRISALNPIHQMAEAYGVAHEEVDGMDVLAMMDVMDRAVRRARETSRPSFIEARCSRFRGHSMSDPGKYRTKEELEAEKAQDPIPKLGAVLQERFGVAADRLEAIDRAAKDEMKQALARAEKAPWPAKEMIFKHIYASQPDA